jgi:hypothetical protein
MPSDTSLIELIKKHIRFYNTGWGSNVSEACKIRNATVVTELTLLLKEYEEEQQERESEKQ